MPGPKIDSVFNEKTEAEKLIKTMVTDAMDKHFENY